MHSFALPLAKPIRLCSGLFTGFLGSLALALAGAGPVAANPFGVERQGGDAIAAIKSLTPEQARGLVAKRTDATARIGTGKAALAFARGGVSLRGALMLTSLESLDAETAAVLAGFKGARLELDGATLSAEVVRELDRFPGVLLLRGLTTLSDNMLAALAGFNGGGLGLGGLTALSPDLAKRLATFATKFLFLDDVTELSPEAAQALAGFPGTVSLDGLTELSPELVRALGDFNKRSLKGVTSLSPETAAALLASPAAAT